jgi:hypothetical protein
MLARAPCPKKAPIFQHHDGYQLHLNSLPDDLATLQAATTAGNVKYQLCIDSRYPELLLKAS